MAGVIRAMSDPRTSTTLRLANSAQSRPWQSYSSFAKASVALSLLCLCVVLAALAYRFTGSNTPDDESKAISASDESVSMLTSATGSADERIFLERLNIADPDQRERALQQWFAGLSPAAFQAFKKTANGILLSRRLTLDDPKALSARADLMLGVRAFLQEYGAREGRAALDFLRRLPADESVDAYARSAIVGWMREDASAVARYLDIAISKGSAQDRALATQQIDYFINEFLVKEPKEFQDWLAKAGATYSPVFVNSVVDSVIVNEAGESVAQTASLLDRYDKELQLSNATMQRFSAEYADADPAAALAWASRRGSEQAVGTTASSMVRQMAEEDSLEESIGLLNGPSGAQLKSRLGSAGSGARGDAYGEVVVAFVDSAVDHHGSNYASMKQIYPLLGSIKDPALYKQAEAKVEDAVRLYFTSAQVDAFYNELQGELDR